MTTKTTLNLLPGDTLDDGDVVLGVWPPLRPNRVAVLRVVRGSFIAERYDDKDAEHTVVASAAKLLFHPLSVFGGEPMGPIFLVSDRGDRTYARPEWVVLSDAQDYAARLGLDLDTVSEAT